ncbi:MAG: hypothetical protein WD360_00350 [Nitriliruptoraceae bacterium]
MSETAPDEHSTAAFTVGDEEQAVRLLATLETQPLTQRVDTLNSVHERLTQALSELDHL